MIPGSLELRGVGRGAQGSEAEERGMRRPPRGCSLAEISGTRPPQGARGPSEKRSLSGLFRAISFLVTLVYLTHLLPIRAEGIWVQTPLFGEGASQQPEPRWFLCPPFSLEFQRERLGSVLTMHTFSLPSRTRRFRRQVKGQERGQEVPKSSVLSKG